MQATLAWNADASPSGTSCHLRSLSFVFSLLKFIPAVLLHVYSMYCGYSLIRFLAEFFSTGKIMWLKTCHADDQIHKRNLLGFVYSLLDDCSVVLGQTFSVMCVLHY
jgi:hypothetical protein